MGIIYYGMVGPRRNLVNLISRDGGAIDLSLQSSIAVPKDVVFQILGDEAVLLNLKTGFYFGLDPVGTRMWQLIVEYRSLARVLEALLQEYDADRQVLEQDLLELGRRVCAKGLAAVTE